MSADFAMFTEEGDRAVASMVREARALTPEARDAFLQCARHRRLITLLVPVPSTRLKTCRATADMIRLSSSA